MVTAPTCVTCAGSGEFPTERGPVDCPDCGGTGELPSRATLVDWRARDIDRAVTSGRELRAEDARWLVSELRAARGALTEIIALAHDVNDPDAIGSRIRFVANRALGLYQIGAVEPREPAVESRDRG
jgi:hypothetical protein